MQTEMWQEVVETLFGISFQNPELLRQALTTRNRQINVEPDVGCGERMEVLGDAALRFLAVEYIHKKLREGREGKVTMIVDKVVANKFLGNLACQLGIDQLIRTGPYDPHPSTSSNGSLYPQKIHSDALEAIFGAIILDQGRTLGLECIDRFLAKHIFPACDEFFYASFEELRNPMDRVQQLARLRFKKNPKYLARYARTNFSWICECVVGRNVLGRSQGQNRKDAQRNAAQNALEVYFANK